MFCPQTFGTAAAKDEHILEHFAQETCIECNRNLIRIGGCLYMKHEESTCTKQSIKSEDSFASAQFDEPNNLLNSVDCVLNGAEFGLVDGNEFPFKENAQIKTEQEDAIEFEDELNGNEDLFQYQSNECYDQSVPSTICKGEIQLEEEPLEQNDTNLLDEHSNINPNASVQNTTIECEICGRQLGSKSALARHNILLHTSDKIFCNICGKLFPTIDDRDLHRVECTEKKKIRNTKRLRSNLRCTKCNISFQLNSSYRQHMQHCHKRCMPKFTCARCKKVFLNESSLHEHQCLGSKAVQTNAFPCETCGKQVGSKSALARHKLLLHSPDKIVCNICGKLFSTIEEHNVHRIECAEKKRIRNLKYSNTRCDLCWRSFKTEQLYQFHMQRKHKQRVQSYKVLEHLHPKHLHERSPISNRFECKMCGQDFKYKQSLQRHQFRKHKTDNALIYSIS